MLTDYVITGRRREGACSSDKIPTDMTELAKLSAVGFYLRPVEELAERPPHG